MGRSEESKAQQREYHKSPEAQARRLAYSRTPEFKARRLEYLYGIIQADWDILYYEQGGECGICKAAKKLYVDHHHVSGKVRGLLCRNCNLLIGLAHENPNSLRAAAKWLEKS